MGIPSLGALAGGLAGGIDRGLRIRGDLEDREWNREQRDRLRKQQTDADAEMAAIRAANEAGAQVMRQHQQEYQRQLPGPSLDGKPVESNPFRPTPGMMLEAGRARTDKLLSLTGPNEAWMKAWASDEAMRGQIRQQSAIRVKQALASGMNPTESLSEFFGTIEDGTEVRGVQPVQGPDGKPALAIQRANRYSGQVDPQPLVIPADKLIAQLDAMAANPADVAKHSMAMSLEAFKQAGTKTEIVARGDEERKTARDKHGYRMEEIDKSSAGAKAVAETRRGGEGDRARAEAIRALGQERTSVDNDIRTLAQQIKDARPSDRVGLQSQLEEARSRANDIRRRLAELSAGQTGDTVVQGSPMDAVMRDAEKQGLSEFDVQIGGQPRMTVRRGSAAPAAAPPSPAAKPQPLPKSKAELKAGTVYQTSRGPAKWNGSAFEAQ